MVGRLLSQLHDVLAQVGLDDLESSLFERAVEVDFLGGHRLGLHHGLRAGLPGDADDEVAGLRSRAGPMHPRAARFEASDELFQVPVEVVDGLPFAAGRQAAGTLVILEQRLLLVPLDLVLAKRGLDQAPMTEIGAEPAGILPELAGGGGRAHEPARISAR